MNRVTLVGRLTRDLELRTSSSGINYVKFSVAINRFGTNNEQTDFINCTAWGKNAVNMTNFLTKGSRIGVDGSIQSSTFDDNQGVKRYVIDVNANRVFFLENRKNPSSNNNFSNTNENDDKTNESIDDYFSSMK